MDKRYDTVRTLINTGHIRQFRDIFDTLPRSTVAKDLGLNYGRFYTFLNDVSKFCVKDLWRLAAFLEVEPIKIMELICNQYKADHP